MAAPLLEIRDIDKRFPGVHVLRGVSLTLPASHVLGVVGENGAGKSTLMKILAGAYTADAGEILIDGAPLPSGPSAALDAGIAVIYQELSLVPEMTVVENMFLGNLPRRGPFIDRRTARQRARAALARVGLADLDPDRRVVTLGLNVRQLVEIAKALARNARILVMDEPTAALQRDNIETLFDVVRDLRSDGIGVIYISHHLEEIFALCDSAMVLRDGQAVRTQPIHDWDESALVHAMVARELRELYPWRPREPGPVVLEVSGLHRPPRVRGVSLQVRAGEILGIAGIAGAGRTELLKTIAGATPATSGRIAIDGKAVPVRSTRTGLRAGIVYAPEDRKTEGLLLEAPVENNLVLSALTSTSRFGVINRRARRAAAEDLVKRFSIKASSIKQETGTLSGGNQQKIILGRVTGTRPKVILLDEPTRGIDVGAKAEIYGHVLDLAEQGAAVVLVSSELPELLGMSDRILVMRQGRIAAELGREQADQETVMRWATSG
ncbi:sugar ABC transporter ATP-binding protein [Cryptosporangium sp. NPDC048952]|uniref:sugar ABC transporter ATP-binding protein n=1 Tax=Cryptosporangium sp. NPDC048952 TaxID=3363961 RepID=UPI003720918D